MEFYVVQWANFEDIDDCGVACYASKVQAMLFLRHKIEENWSKDHEGTLELGLDDIELDEVVDPEQLFPYVYKISKQTIL